MINKVVSVVLSVVVSLSLFGCSEKEENKKYSGPKLKQFPELTKEEKLEDFNYMYKVILEGYPYLEVNKRLNNVEWLSKKEEYINRIRETVDDKAFINELDNIVDELNNLHTSVVKDKLFFQALKNAYTNSEWYGFWEDEKTVSRYEYNSTKAPKDRRNYNSQERETLALNDVVYGKVGYMYLPQMGRKNVPMADDLKMVEDYIKGLDNYKALIIDIRGNSGGNDTYWESIVSMLIKSDMYREGYCLVRNSDIIKKYLNKRYINNVKDIKELPTQVLKNAPKEVTRDFNKFFQIKTKIRSNPKSKFNGDIYLLVDKSVYSSSESFSIFAKETGFATLIGETTGGDGGGIDPVLFRLPNSGLIIRMSSEMFLSPSGVCDEEFKVKPDYEMAKPERAADTSYDQCIKKVLEIEEVL